MRLGYCFRFSVNISDILSCEFHAKAKDIPLMDISCTIDTMAMWVAPNTLSLLARVLDAYSEMKETGIKEVNRF
jgi:hypothetical protein